MIRRRALQLLAGSAAAVAASPVFAQNLIPIRVGTFASEATGSIFYAQDQGFLAKHGLTAQLTSHLEGMTATHDGRVAFGRFNPAGSYPISVHPVVAKHPDTGRKLLYVNRGFSSHINDVPPEESAALLNYLYAHLEKPHFHVRFVWQKHSVAFWDNRCTQHLAVWDYFPQTRNGYRIQIEGTQPPIPA